MQPIPFVAATAEEAVAQIRAKLGPEAVVLNVRRLPVNGLARLWQKPMIEVLAYKEEPKAPEIDPISQALADFRQQLSEIKQQVENREPVVQRQIPVFEPEATLPPFASEDVELNTGDWRVGGLLQKSGMAPLHVQSVLDQLRLKHGEKPPGSLTEEIEFTRYLLGKSWCRSAPIAPNSIHVLVGPAGSGKTTSLCKWLTQSALVEGRLTRVWRLDGSVANAAESLSIYCEILGTPCERSWQTSGGVLADDIGFIDLPGVDWRKPEKIKELGRQLQSFGSPQVHLVLNGAYETSLLMAQLRAFSILPIQDLTITHLDEESRWGKIWNLVLGTNYSIRHFSTGQNIPGDFCEASAEMIFARQFPRI
jgi:flagellar biosynthesis protein FlhF